MRLLKNANGLAGIGGSAIATIVAGALTAGTALADTLPTIGHPESGKLGLQPAVTPVAQEVHFLDHMIMIIITLIVLFVMGLLLAVILRYNHTKNPTPAKFTHNTPLEIAWTLIPVLILVFIGSFSLPALFNQIQLPKSDMTIKVTGNQWYWNYAYPDQKVDFDSNMLGNAATATDDHPYVLNDAKIALLKKYGYTKDDWLLAVDNPLIVPVNKTIKVEVTGADVIHAWYVPSFGIMLSAVPGRLNETWFKATKEGVYYGQCTTLCGQYHAYMPIEVKVVSQAAYDKWLAGAKKGNYQLASN